jgi:hypothetical protein
MDERAFDSLTRKLSNSTNRRTLIGGVFGLLLGAFRAAQSRPASAQMTCTYALIDCYVHQICVNGICEDCPQGLIPCDAYCADLSTDPNNCGLCGRYCASGVCENSSCLVASACSPGLTLCGTGCSDLSSDIYNCGYCGNVCGGIPAPGYSGVGECVNGTCQSVCLPEADYCDGECTDLSISNEHCGSCGNRCGDGQPCCQGRCVSRDSAERFCDWCGCLGGWPQGCNADEICDRGLCVSVELCAELLTDCNGSCKDLL